MSESTHNQNRQSRARTTRAIQRIHQIPQIFNLQNIALVLTILLILPLIAVISRGILENTSGWQHLAQTVLPKWSLNTLALCSMVAPGVLLLGLPPAWIVSRYNFKTRKILEVALVLPLAVPAYISAMALGWLLDGAGPLQSALRTLFNANGALLPPIRSIGGAALILSLALYPYVYLLARKAFLLEGGEAFEIARSLGAKPLRAFTRIALPLARPALVAGIALALMETLAEYGALQLLGVNTWTTAVFRAWLSMGDPALAARLASFLLLAVALVLLAERSLRKGRNFAFARAKPKLTTRPQLNPKYTSIAIIICAYPPLLGFILPGAVLLHLALQTTPDAGLINAIRASLSLSLASIFTILLPVLPIAYGLRRRGQRQIHGLSGLSVGANGRIASLVTNTITLGYATPGAVIAIGVVTVFATIGGGGAILALGVAGLLYAYAVRFAAPALEVIDAGLAKIRPSLEDAARGLGCNTPKTLLRVHLPLLWPSLATAALVVFVEVLKELPATLLIRPFGFETLAVRAWSLAADERLHQASYPALLIMGVGIIPVWLLLRTTGGGVPPQVASRHRLKCAALVGAAPPLLTRRGWVRGCQRKAL